MSIPQELITRNQWVCWRLTPDKSGGKDRKMPFDPKTGKAAKSNDTSTWGTYDSAAEALDHYGYTGIGYMFSADDGYVGVDIDHCYDPQKHEFSEMAKAIIEHQATYTEFSPSGTGVHLLFKGQKPKGGCRNTQTGVEMYDGGRYFTVTGRQVPGTPDIIAEDNGALAWIHSMYIKPPGKSNGETKKGSKKKKRDTSEKLTDEEVLEKALSAGDNGLFASLYEGNWQDKYGSQSEADMALCMKLAFWTAKDAEQMDRLFRASRLMRDKWDEAHRSDGTTYGQETIAKAIEQTDQVYTPGGGVGIIEYEGQYFRVRDDRVTPLTNFVVRPVEMIETDDECEMTADFVTVRGETIRLTLMTTDLANQQKFKNLLSKRTISLAYFGGDGDLEQLKTYLSELDWPRKRGVKAMGIYEHTGRLVYVSRDGAIESGGVLVADIVQLDRYVSIVSGILDCEPLTKGALTELGKILMSYNEPAKTIPILAWCAGCFVKEHLRLGSVKFPHLFLIGQAGSGKSTTLEHVILPIFSCGRVTAATQVTSFTLMKESASSNMIPLALDEFKPSKMDRIRLGALYNHFRDSYDGHDGVRGRADLSVVTYDLSAPLVVAGEESPDEAAIRERSVELLFSKKDLKDPNRRMAFNGVMSSEEKLSDLGRTLLNTALKVTSTEVLEWHSEGKRLFNTDLPSRVISNLACCYAGLRLLEKVCAEHALSFDHVFPYKLSDCAGYLEYAVQNYLLDGDTNNQSTLEQTFEIMARMNLDPKTQYRIEEGKLYLWLAPVYDQYTKYRKDYAITGEILPYAQFRKQLQHSEYFINAAVQKKIGSENRRCWVVNFDLLRQHCDVSGFETTDIEPLV